MARDIFNGCTGLTSLSLSEWNVKNIDSALQSLPNKESLVQLDVSKADTSGVTSLFQLFYGCSSLKSLDVANWDVSKVTNFARVFEGCSSLESVNVSKWDVSMANTLDSMFEGCSALKTLDVSGWDTSKVDSYYFVFRNCSSLSTLDISGWKVTRHLNTTYAFSGCTSLSSLTVGPGFGSLRNSAPSGPWYDASGNYYSDFPRNASGTYTTYPPATSGDEEPGDASTAPMTPEVPAVTEGELDGLTYLVVPEGAVDAAGEAYVFDREYADLGGRYVGAGVYVTAYRGEAADLALPAQIEGADVVSADLSWSGDAQTGVPDPDGRTRLESLSLERGCRLTSLDASGSGVVELKLAGDEALGGLPALRFLDLSGTRVSSLDPAPMPALERLALRGCPLGVDSLEALTAWSGATGLPADLEGAGAKDEPSEPEQPAEPSQPGEPVNPNQPGEPSEPAAPAEPEQPSNPTEPSEPAVPSEPGQPSEPEQPAVPSGSATPDEPSEPAEPAGPSEPADFESAGDSIS